MIVHCPTKNLPRRFIQLAAVRNSWLDSLLTEPQIMKFLACSTQVSFYFLIDLFQNLTPRCRGCTIKTNKV
jgi:hypothetical protein